VFIFQEQPPRLERDEKKCFLAAIVESSSDGIISNNLEGIITSWNKGAEAIYGYSAKDAIGKHIHFIIPKESVKEIESILNKIQNGDQFDHFETVMKTKKGEKIFVSLNISPIKDSDNNITGFSIISREITVRKQAELLLHEYQEHLENLIEIKTLELNKKLKELNSLFRLSKIFEKDNLTTEMIINHVISILPNVFHYPDSVSIRIEYANKVYLNFPIGSKNLVFEKQISINQKNFQLKIFYDKEKVIIQEEIDLINEILKRVKDYFEKLNAINKLKKKNEELDSFIFNTYDYIFIISEDYKILYNNRFSYNITNLDDTCYKIIYQQDQPCENCIINNKNDLYKSSINLKKKVRYRGSNSFRFFDILCGKMNDIGEKDVFVEIIKDITPKKELDEKINSLISQLKVSKEKLNDGSVDTINHLNELIRAILSYSKLLEKCNRNQLIRHTENYIKQMARSILRIDNYIDRLKE